MIQSKPNVCMSFCQELGVSFSREQLEELAQKLDTNSDGRVFYGYVAFPLQVITWPYLNYGFW